MIVVTVTFARLPTCPPAHFAIDFYSHVRLSNITFAGVATAANRVACIIIKARKLENTCPDAVRMTETHLRSYSRQKKVIFSLFRVGGFGGKKAYFYDYSLVMAMAMVRIASVSERGVASGTEKVISVRRRGGGTDLTAYYLDFSLPLSFFTLDATLLSTSSL